MGIYNYVEREYYEQKRSIFKKRIGFIGRFTKEKNLDLLTLEEQIQAVESIEMPEHKNIRGNTYYE